MNEAFDVVNHLLERIKVTPGGCFEWQATIDHNGYGKVSSKKLVSQYAHRVSFHTFRQPLDGVNRGRKVCHKCDNPCCINPAHLFLGTQAENIADMVSKDRHARGERSASAKLTEENARAIVQMYADGVPTQEIQEKFGVGHFTVLAVVKGDRWGYLNLPKVPVRSKGRCQKGFLNNHTVLNPEMVQEIKDLHKQGLSERAIGKKLGISRSPVSNVLTKKSFDEAV